MCLCTCSYGPAILMRRDGFASFFSHCPTFKWTLVGPWLNDLMHHPISEESIISSGSTAGLLLKLQSKFLCRIQGPMSLVAVTVRHCYTAASIIDGRYDTTCDMCMNGNRRWRTGALEQTQIISQATETNFNKLRNVSLCIKVLH